MATIHASNLLSSSSYSSSSKIYHGRRGVQAMLQVPKLKTRTPRHFYLPKLPARSNEPSTSTITKKELRTNINHSSGNDDKDEETSNSTVTAELYMIMEAVSERVEMHTNIGEQRNNWNTLLLNSINAITIAAATMTGLAASTGAIMGSSSSVLLALKVSSTLLYSAATGMLLVMNKIQPSQLAEEQRNAARLFKQLHEQIRTKLSLSSSPTRIDVKQAMDKVLALDRAYPLPLLGGVMIEKLPKTVEPAIWWPQQKEQEQQQQQKKFINNGQQVEENGWSDRLEKEMKDIIQVLKTKDIEEYTRLSKMVLNINKILAISGPLLTSIGAFSSAFVGSSSHGSTAAVLFGVVAGALTTVVNTLEHGGQVGMVFEMYRACAGSFKLLEETIESTLQEREIEKRENGKLFEMKVALQLGRSLSDLRNLAAAGSLSPREFASKLF